MADDTREPGTGGDTGGGGGDGGDGGGGGEGRRRRARSTLFGQGGWFRRFARLWGFAAFCVLVLFLARSVLLPFVFAGLLAYILAPIIDWMSRSPDGGKRMPRGLAIILCYLVIIAFMAMFMVILLPRISKDAARLGREAPKLYEKFNNEWAPQLARWIEKTFPSMTPETPEPVETPIVADVPVPPGTAFIITPLPDGRYAIEITREGIDVSPLPGGAFHIKPNEEVPEKQALEDKIRAWGQKALGALQSELGDFFKFGQALIGAVIRGVFGFFLVLMVCGFILIDTTKIHGFVKSLVPQRHGEDYDLIIAGMNRGLAGVIRGQLLICLINGCLTYVGMMIFGVKYALILSAVAAIMSLIPIFGSILSTIPIVIAALVSGDAGIDIARGLAALAWICGIHFLEGNFLNPKIIGTAAKIHPVLVIFALIVGEHTYGLVGALLAVPLLSMTQVLFLYFRDRAWKEDGVAGAGRATTFPPGVT